MVGRLTHSLRGRLAITTLFILLLFLGFTGYALDRAFQNSIENALLERLTVQIYALLSAAEVRTGQLFMPETLPDPELNRIDSGRYAWVTDRSGAEIWRSPSAVSLDLNTPEAVAPGRYSLTETQFGKEALFLFSYGIIWENLDGSETRYNFHILQDQAPTAAEISTFRTTLWRWLGGMGVLLLLIQAAVLRWGLAPLPRLAEDLIKIEQGSQEQLSGNYPSELEGVAHNLNILIANERRQRQRYRNTLADLAHSLKTPLAILRGINADQLNTQPRDAMQTIETQVARMDQIVSYQLQRAASPTVSLITRPVPLEPLVQKLMRSMTKVYQDKKLNYQLEIEKDCQFNGDERDLLEVLGNLLDNAFKACRSRVRLTAGATITQPHRLIISIEDDGAGVPSAMQQEILKRGVRADSSHPGQGIGLAVAREIIDSYGGRLSIDRSDLGGARFSIELPGRSGL